MTITPFERGFQSWVFEFFFQFWGEQCGLFCTRVPDGACKWDLLLSILLASKSYCVVLKNMQVRKYLEDIRVSLTATFTLRSRTYMRSP